jgi:Rho GDP-dissociation inhibitor
MADDQQDDLAPSLTAGYKPGEKKTIEELAKLDAQDESLKKWKESLGLKADSSK